MNIQKYIIQSVKREYLTCGPINSIKWAVQAWLYTHCDTEIISNYNNIIIYPPHDHVHTMQGGKKQAKKLYLIRYKN